MATKNSKTYNPSEYGRKETELMSEFQIELEDAKNYFINVIKPRLDRSYKLYIAYTGDRKREIKSWQANIFVPYVQAVVETLMPRILDARPEFSVLGRTKDDHIKAEKQQLLGDYYWEKAEMDKTSEDFTRAATIYGTGFLQVSWKKDVRKLKFFKSKNIDSPPKWEEEERVFYDAPFCEWVDNYSLWYDWHNTDRKSKQFWFKRLILTEEEIKRRYPSADKKRLEMALASQGGDMTDYAAIRQQVKSTHDRIIKSGDQETGVSNTHVNDYSGKYTSSMDAQMKMYEVFEWYRPFHDQYAVMVGSNWVPIFKNAYMPFPYDFKETPFIEAAYLKVPGEFEGYGIPIILENPQIMLNLIKNQRLDAATLNIHKMWIVNPLANVDRNQLVTRPFGIIYSIDPNGVREIQFSDIKSSAYKEEEMLKSDMRYSSGVDDFSMGAGGSAASATEVRHLRESTLERVRMFVNHLGSAYADVLRYWMDMSRQLMSKEMTIRIIEKDGEASYPIIEKEDLLGMYDYKARVLPAIAGQQEIDKKQSMDVYQLLANIDPGQTGINIKKLTSWLVSKWGVSLDTFTAEDEGPGFDQADIEAMEAGGMAPVPQNIQPEVGGIEDNAFNRIVSRLRAPGEEGSPFNQAASPINLLESKGQVPPTPRGIENSGKGGSGVMKKNINSRGLNRTGKVNTNIPTGRKNANPDSSLLNRVYNIQR